MSNYKLTLEEQETIITCNAAERKTYVSTAYPPHIRHYDKLAKLRPDYCECVRKGDPYSDYVINDKRKAQILLKPYGFKDEESEEE